MQLLKLSGLFAILLLTACRPSEKKPDSVLTATLKGPSAMAMIKMIKDKPVLGKGYSTVFEIKNEPMQVQAMIMEGKPDFAVVPSTMAALLYNKGQDYQLAAIPVWGSLYLFGSDTSIHKWSDLKARRISLMARGNTPDVLFRYLASVNGLEADRDYQTDYSFAGHIELANAIASGVSDLGVISEPLVSMVQKRNPAVKPLLDLNLEWYNKFGDSIPFTQTALLVKRQFAINHPEIVSEYLDRLKESVEWVNSHPEQAASLIVKYEILPDSALALVSIPRSNLKFALASKEKKGIQEYLKVFYNFNPLIIGGKLPDDEFYYQKPAD
ncbi:MAG: ABC transporter substrate-binding protein [Bacteroidales bacterium]|nr:ABC transporter substrate-binding protein [Bacteroidales bacterium]